MMIRRNAIPGHPRRTQLSALAVGCVSVLAAFAPLLASAQEQTTPKHPAEIRAAKPHVHAHRSMGAGSLVIAGGGNLPDSIINRFIELSGGLNARLVIITSASTIADSPDIEWRMGAWHEQPVSSVHILHTRSRDVANSPEFCREIDEATGVWFIGGNQLSVTSVYQGTKTEERLHALLKRGGVIGGTSAGAAIMSRVMIGGNKPEGPMIATGFGFLPGVIVDQHFIKRNRQNRLFKALATEPGLVGVGIDEGTALVVTPNGLEVLGDSQVIVCLPGTEQRREITQRYDSGQHIDFDSWSMAAAGRARWDSYTKADKRPVPDVPKGAVVISGRNTPEAAVEEFLTAAGGKNAPVVVVTETGKDGDSDMQTQLEGFFANAGADNVQVCHASTARELEKPEVKQALAQARGVWFVGAQERKMMDFVLQARMDRLVKDILERGGVIGGSSAGAEIHGDGVIHPVDDTDPLGDIYACGLGVLPGIVIEQQKVVDNASASSIAKTLRQRFPWCLGVGLQDSAAVVVRGHTMKVLGSQAVAVIGEPGDDEDSTPEIEMLQAGQKYDLRERRVMDTEEAVTR